MAFPTSISDWNGTACQAVIPALYALSHGSIANVSANYPAFYASRLGSFTYYPDFASDAPFCQQIETIAMQKLAGQPTSIQPLADQFGRSAKPSDRRKAIALKLAGGDMGLTRLRAMAQDPAAEVALYARNALHELADGK